MGMNQPQSPRQRMFEEQENSMQHQDPSSFMNEQPAAQETQSPDPMEALPLVLLSYMDFATETRDNKVLAEPIKAQILSQMAQAINYLVPLLPKVDPQAEQDMQLKVAELEMKAQEHMMNLEMKKQELEMKREEYQMNMQFKQQESQMKLQQSEEQHQQKLVQTKEQGEIKAQQQKQAAQSKPTNKQGK